MSTCVLYVGMLASFPGRREEEKRVWFPLFAHALNRGGIPPALRTFNLNLYTCDVKVDTKCYVVCTVSIEYLWHAL